MASFCAPKALLAVRKTALWSEPPSHWRSGNFPSTERPSQVFQNSILVMTGICDPTFYAMRQAKAHSKLFTDAAIFRPAQLPCPVAETHLGLLIEYKRPHEGERCSGAWHVHSHRQNARHALLQAEDI